MHDVVNLWMETVNDIEYTYRWAGASLLDSEPLFVEVDWADIFESERLIDGGSSIRVVMSLRVAWDGHHYDVHELRD